MITVPELKHVATLEIKIDSLRKIGKTLHGDRRIIPILGSKVTGNGGPGQVLSGGADYQFIVSPKMPLLDTCYAIETDQGERIYIHNEAMRVASAEITQKIKGGELVDPKHVYFRSVPKFETGADRFQWITERVFIGVGIRKPTLVELQLFQILKCLL